MIRVHQIQNRADGCVKTQRLGDEILHVVVEVPPPFKIASMRNEEFFEGRAIVGHERALYQLSEAPGEATLNFGRQRLIQLE